MKRIANNSHITFEGRKIIEERLNEGISISKIALEMCRYKSTITREIERHTTLFFPSTFNNTHPCIKNKDCHVKSFECYRTCKNIEINLCDKLTSSPHVCNSCKSKQHCRHVKKYYKALEANCEYLNSWKSDRSGLRYTNDELRVLNTDFYNLVINTRSIYHSLIVINSRGFEFNKSNIYRQIKNGNLRLRYSDLPRNQKKKKQKRDTLYKNEEKIKGHTFEDYQYYKSKNKKALETQMDTVVGIVDADDPVMLTLEIVKMKFLFIIKLDRKTFNQTLNKLKNFRDNITPNIFNKIMEILLTDNGSEFKDVKTIVKTFPEINFFYCHPNASYEKGNLENNHEMIRRVIPKGISLKIYNQQDYNKLASHINSLYRKTLQGQCSFDLIEEYIPMDILNNLGLKKIPDDKIMLTPSLLGDKNIQNIKKYKTIKEIKKLNIRINKEGEIDYE